MTVIKYFCKQSFIYSILLISGCSIQGDESQYLEQLRLNPTGSPEAATWFASLPLDKKREYAARIGQIVIDSPDESFFVVAFGASQSPYPWAMTVGDGIDGLKLCAGNYFKYMFLDEGPSKRQWAVCWFVEDSYLTNLSEGKVGFAKWDNKKKDPNRPFGIWITGPKWQYVGPELKKFGPETEQEQNAIYEIKKLDGLVEVDIRASQYRVNTVHLPPNTTDNELKHVKQLSHLLQHLHLWNVNITDAGLENLEGLTHLQELFLSGNKITDAGLVHLKGLKGLKVLKLECENITDPGLEHLKGLLQLETLDLRRAKITDKGILHLKEFGNLQNLNLFFTNITDAGLEYLEALKQLKSLNLQHTKITDNGLKYLKKINNLQDLDLAFTQISDAGLKHLEAMTQLKTLRLSSTKVTDAGIAKLQQALPECRINK